jgi:hypothetical protein
MCPTDHYPQPLKKGNENALISEYPGLLARYRPIITVGAIDNEGEIAPSFQGGELLRITAPGRGIRCAGKTRNDDQIMSGTSVGMWRPAIKLRIYHQANSAAKTASPIAAGVAAYLLSLDKYRTRLQVPGQVAKHVMDMMTELAWPRQKGGFPVVWNAATDTCSARRRKKKKKKKMRHVRRHVRRQQNQCTMSSSLSSSAPPLASSSSSTTPPLTMPDITLTPTTTKTSPRTPTPEVNTFPNIESCPTRPGEMVSLSCLNGADQTINITSVQPRPGRYKCNVRGSCIGGSYNVAIYWLQGVKQVLTLDPISNSANTVEAKKPCEYWKNYGQ